MSTIVFLEVDAISGQEASRESLRTEPLERKPKHGRVLRDRPADPAGVAERDILPGDAFTAEGLREHDLSWREIGVENGCKVPN
jgi:hypothetical protein